MMTIATVKGIQNSKSSKRFPFKTHKVQKMTSRQNELLQKETAFLDSWAEKVPGFVKDGIINHEYYVK